MTKKKYFTETEKKEGEKVNKQNWVKNNLDFKLKTIN